MPNRREKLKCVSPERRIQSQASLINHTEFYTLVSRFKFPILPWGYKMFYNLYPFHIHDCVCCLQQRFWETPGSQVTPLRSGGEFNKKDLYRRVIYNNRRLGFMQVFLFF